MTASKFISNEKQKLISTLELYLAGACPHSSVQETINQIFTAWELVTNKDSAYEKNEETFWCAVWSTQHLATEDHWRDGVTQKDLTTILHSLKEHADLPEGWSGKRP